jgi:peptidoglycan hydrolase-like protein with peptidoglycan-binding domain
MVFLLLSSGISRPHGTPPASRANVSKDMPAVAQRDDVKKIQEALQDNGQYGGKVDGVLGLRTRASIRGFQKAENLPITGQLDSETAGKLGVRPESREEAAHEVTQGKPSAGIKWGGSLRRTSKTPRKAIDILTRTVPPAYRESESKEH